MSVVCPSCEHDPPAGAVAGAACPACATPLVVVRDAEDLLGTVIDHRFEIVALLGKGGMGTVYRATQRSIGRDVALKLIDRRFEEDVVSVKRFLREAKLASQLSHPNSVGVIECGQSQDGRLYLAMELVRGRTLQAVLAGGALPIERVIRIGIQLCDALEAAHALSIVHRDLKLENVMLLDGERDVIKVLDFGLARSLTEYDDRATATGAIVGTPRYLAPEVALGGAAAAPAQDLYALGVVLGELALGGVLWDAPTLEVLFTLKLHGVPRLEPLPAGLRALVERLLDPDPAARPTAGQTRAALEALQAGNPIALERTLALPGPIVTPPALPSAAFAPPSAPEASLVLEDEWHREKANKVAHAVRAPVKRPARIAGIVVAVACIAIVVGVVAYLGTRTPAPAKAQPSTTPNTVSISVTAPASAAITFDHQPAGHAPLTMYVRRSKQALLITAVIAGLPQTRSIVPDRDQSVDFAPP